MSTEASALEVNDGLDGRNQAGDASVLALGASVGLTGALAARALNLVSQVLMARLLGATSFGLYAIGWTLVRILGSLGTLGHEAGIIYFGATYQRQPSKFKGAMVQSLVIPFVAGTAIAVTMWICAPVLADRIFHKPDALPVIRLFGLALPFYTVCFVAGGITKLSHRMQYFVYSGLAQAAAALLLFCVLFFLGFGLPGAIVATSAGFLVGALVSAHYVRRLFPAAVARRVKSQWPGPELFTYSISIMLAGIASNGQMFVDRLFVAAFRSAADTGVYQAASQLSIMFGILLGAFHGIFRPMVADIHARGDHRRLAELYRVCSKWTLYASLPLFLIILSVSTYLVQLLYGKAYEGAATPLIILSAAQLFTGLTAGSHTMLVMTGRQKTFVILSFASLLIDVLLALALVPGLGLTGAAIATATSGLFFSSATVLAVKEYFGIWPVDARMLKGCVATLATLGALFLLKRCEFATPALRVLTVACASVTVFAVCLGLLGLDSEDADALYSLRRRLMSVRF
ncbi:MAG TPA: oligosaccharide flippase family protein [Candidatus Binataceae bacterium]|nr:oligosaccharide flippase family protein [Candidatus Binataceae bacterium]